MVVLAPIAAAAATGFGSAAGSSLIDAIFNRGGGTTTNYSALLPGYAAQLGAGQQAVTSAANAAAQATGAELGALGLEARLAADQQLAGYTTALARGQAAQGLELGRASQYASALTDLQSKTGESKLALSLMPAETQKSLADVYGQAASLMGKETTTKLGDIGTGSVTSGGAILGQGVAGAAKAYDSGALAELYKPSNVAAAEAGAQTVAGQNKLVSDIVSTNLRIAEQQEATRNQLALQRSNIEGQLALKRFGRSTALAGKASIA